MKHKNIGACGFGGINIIDNISRSWVHKEKMGVRVFDVVRERELADRLRRIRVKDMMDEHMGI